MTKQSQADRTPTALLSHLFFVAGLAAVVYGIWLWSHPLAFVLGGLFVALIAFLVGYPDVAKGRAR